MKKLSMRKPRSQYTKSQFLSDVLLVLRGSQYKLKGAEVAEVIDVSFAIMQQAFLQRGSIPIPDFGTLQLELDEDGKAQFSFIPSADLVRRTHAAMAVD